jgi:hypothetical protein
MKASVAILVALLAVAVALIAVELTGASGTTVTVADPCRVRAQFPGQGIDSTIQRLVLDGLDRAACRLHTTREELVLSLRPGSGKQLWSQKEIETALRSGLLASVQEAENRGEIPAFLAPIVRRVVEHVPLQKLIQGGISLSDLIG